MGSKSERPEYVKCVKSPKTDKSWCELDWGEKPFFQDVDHAVLSGLNQSRLLICGYCRQEIIKAMDNGCKYV